MSLLSDDTQGWRGSLYRVVGAPVPTGVAWIKPPLPFIDPACATLGALRVRFRATRYTQDDTKRGEAPYGFDSATLTLSVSS